MCILSPLRHDTQPHPRPGQVIGLLGGSFDPPHQGHVHITREALRRFGLDAVWWLLSPGNPLKPRGPAPLDLRLAAARAIMDHPRVQVTDIEARIGTRHTARTLAWLCHRYPRTRFVWLMGADNLAQFHHWHDWSGILDRVPVGVLARPGQGLRAMNAPAARRYRAARLPRHRLHLLGRLPPPVWGFAHVPLSALSSSAIRAEGGWDADRGGLRGVARSDCLRP